MLGSMAGSTMKRMRKAGIPDPGTGDLVQFPCMPLVAELPAAGATSRPQMKITFSA
jgi:hypothetical protein